MQTEIKILGRGGQGGKSLGEIIAKTAISLGRFAQAFPEYTAERKGAPVRSFVRISDEEIRIHTEIQNPDVVIVLDETMLKNPSLIGSLKEDSKVIVNSTLSPDMVKKLLGFKGRIFVLDADSIALKRIGNVKFINTAVLGAFTGITGIFRIDELESEIRSSFVKKIGEEMVQKNISALEEGYQGVCNG